ALTAAPDRHGVHRATTGDGRVEILLGPPEAHRGQAVLRTPRGVFTGPDYDVEIRTPGGRAARRPQGAAGGAATG
ncbi:DUF2397 family protein, partial [Saccharothrix sp. MB29]|nr:DUF2397 family protein [Saccharothrix sp. MB29]